MGELCDLCRTLIQDGDVYLECNRCGAMCCDNCHALVGEAFEEVVCLHCQAIKAEVQP